MMAAIGALFAALMWVVRMVLNRYDSLLNQREEQERELLEQLVRTVTATQAAIATLVDTVKEVQRQLSDGQNRLGDQIANIERRAQGGQR